MTEFNAVWQSRAALSRASSSALPELPLRWTVGAVRPVGVLFCGIDQDLRGSSRTGSRGRSQHRIASKKFRYTPHADTGATIDGLVSWVTRIFLETFTVDPVFSFAVGKRPNTTEGKRERCKPAWTVRSA